MFLSLSLWSFTKVLPISAVASSSQECFCPAVTQVLKGQAGSVAAEPTKARDHKGKSKFWARFWLADTSFPVTGRWDSRGLILEVHSPKQHTLPRRLYSPSKSTSSFRRSASVARGRFSVSSSAMMESKKAMASSTSALNCEYFFGVAFCYR